MRWMQLLTEIPVFVYPICAILELFLIGCAILIITKNLSLQRSTLDKAKIISGFRFEQISVLIISLIVGVAIEIEVRLVLAFFLIVLMDYHGNPPFDLDKIPPVFIILSIGLGLLDFILCEKKIRHLKKE